MKFVLLNGPSNSGKTTIIKKILEEKKNYYRLSYDGQKWFFSKYDRTVHFKAVESIVLTLAEVVCGMRYDIVCDSGLLKEFRKELLSIARREGYEIVEINLEADYKILSERFDKRV